jgi:hypothetical protein
VELTDVLALENPYAGLITRQEHTMDEETAAPVDDLEAIEDDDDLGDGGSGYHCSGTGRLCLN